MASPLFNETDLRAKGVDCTLLSGSTTGEFTLRETDRIWYVANGTVDLFLVHTSADEVIHPYQHVLRASTGDMCFGVERVAVNSGGYIELRAKPSIDAELQVVKFESIEALEEQQILIDQVENWIRAFSDFVVKEIHDTPRPMYRLNAGRFELGEGSTVSARSGVVWFKSDEKSSYLGLIDGKDDAMDYLPLTNRSWIVCASPTKEYEVLKTVEVLTNQNLKTILASFHKRVIQAEELNRVLAIADQANLQLDRVGLRQQKEQEARSALSLMIQRGTAHSPKRGVIGALQLIGRYEAIDFDLVSYRQDKDLPVTTLVPQIAARSGITCRLVRLSSEEYWWRSNNGSLLAFRKADDAPVAIVPNHFGSNSLHDPGSAKSRKITKKVSGELHDYAYMFIEPLPRTPISFRGLLSFLFRNLGSDIARIVTPGIVLGFISLLPAIAIGLLVDWLFVSQSVNLIGLVIATLLCSSVLGLLLQLYQHGSLLQVEGRSGIRLTAAFMDRILRLSRRDLHEVTSGDLAERAMSFNYFRDNLSGAVMQSLASALFFLPAVVLLYVFDPVLAGITMAVGLMSFISIVAIGMSQVRWQKQYLRIHQSLAGKMLQYINGMAKLRTSGAESAVFAQWAQDYREKKHAELKIKQLQAVGLATAMTIPSFGAAMLFLTTFTFESNVLDIGDFLVVYTAAMVFLTAVAQFGNSLSVLASALPAFQRIKPILTREVDDSSTTLPWATTATLTGDIRLDHVSFSYEVDDEPVIEDVSIHVEPGEFVAIVGESGSGKSTLLRLLLGLEKPSTGAVFYDNRNIQHSNLRMLRRNIGVVVQRGELTPGTILDNIIGTTGDASEEDAWLAAEKAAVGREIEAMHMGMYTQVSEDVTLFSGGQTQRILIAAALVRNPSILVLDEATNWLDNECQAEVMQNISSMVCTRIVVAHRLSTIKNADKIYVMSEGKVVEQGTYDELTRADGVFSKLSTRQVSKSDS